MNPVQPDDVHLDFRDAIPIELLPKRLDSVHNGYVDNPKNSLNATEIKVFQIHNEG